MYRKSLERELHIELTGLTLHVLPSIVRHRDVHVAVMQVREHAELALLATDDHAHLFREQMLGQNIHRGYGPYEPHRRLLPVPERKGP